MNCPNCGAVRTGSTCEYCGTKFSEELNIVILCADDAEIFKSIQVEAKKLRSKQQRKKVSEWVT